MTVTPNEQRRLEQERGREVAARALAELPPEQRDRAAKELRLETLARLDFNNNGLLFRREGKNVECRIGGDNGQFDDWTIVAAEVGGPAWPSENFVSMVTLGVIALQGEQQIVTDRRVYTPEQHQAYKRHVKEFRQRWCYEEWTR